MPDFPEEEDVQVETPEIAPAPPVSPDLSSDPGDVRSNIDRIVDHAERTERFNAAQRSREARKAEIQARRTRNAAARQHSEETGAQYRTDAAGEAQPVIDPDTGRQKFTPRTTPVRFDDKGQPYQVETDETGVRRVKNPNADSEYGENPDDPTDPYLYRKNKATPWEPIDPEEGLNSGDRRLVAASAKFLHGRELEKIGSERADIALKLQDPKRPRALTEKQRAELSLQRESLTQPIPRPEPKKSFIGGINQQATAEAEAAWMQEEADRQTQLAQVETSIAADDDRLSLEQQQYDLSVRHKTLKDGGPAGFLQMRRKAASESVAAMPPEQATTRIQQEASTIEQEDTQISGRSAALTERTSALDAEMQRGVSFQRSAEIDRERAEIANEATAIDNAVESRNARVEQLQADARAVTDRRAKERADQISALREDPETAPMADAIDEADREFAGREEQIANLPAGPEREAAVKSLADERRQRLEKVESEIEQKISGKVTEAITRHAGPGGPLGFKAQIDAIEKDSTLTPTVRRTASRAIRENAIDAMIRANNDFRGWERISGQAEPERLDPENPEHRERAGKMLDENPGLLARAFDGFDRVMTTLGSRVFGALGTPLKALGETYSNTPGLKQIGQFGNFLFQTKKKAEGQRDQLRDPRTDDNGIMNRWVMPAVSEALPNLAGILTGPGNVLWSAGQLFDEGYSQADQDPELSEEQKRSAAAVYVVLGIGPELAGDYLTGGFLNTRSLPKEAKRAAAGRASQFLRKSGDVWDRLPPEVKRAVGILSASGGEGVTEVLQDKILNATIETVKTGNVADAIQKAIADNRSTLDTFIVASLSGGGIKMLDTVARTAAERGDKAVQGAAERLGAVTGAFSPEALATHAEQAGVEFDAEAYRTLNTQTDSLRERLAGVNARDIQVRSQISRNILELERRKASTISQIIAGFGNRADEAEAGEGANFRPEHLAAAQAQVEAWQPPASLTPEAAEIERAAASGALKLISGQPEESLLAAERAALGQKLPDKSPRFETVNGTPVITDGQLRQLRMVVPLSASLPIRDEATVRQQALAPKDSNEDETDDGIPSVPQSDQAGASLAPLPVGKSGALVSPREKFAAKQIERRLTDSGVDQATAAGFSRYFVRREGTDEWTDARVGDAVAEFERAGGRENPQAIRDAVVASDRSQAPQIDAIHRKIVSDLGEAYTALPEQQRKRLDGVIRHRLAPELITYAGAVREVVGGKVAHGGAGVGIGRGNTFNVNLPDLIQPGNLAGMVDDVAVERTINEEIGHLANIAALSAIRTKRTGEVGEAFNLARAEAGEIFTQLPKEVREHVREVRGPGLKEADDVLGMEFFRLLLQRDLAVEDGKIVTADGRVLTEQTSSGISDRLREVFRRLIEVFSDLRKALDRQLGAEGRSSEEIAALADRVDVARKASVEIFRGFQKAGDAARTDTYQKAYDAARSKGPRTSSRGGSAGASGPGQSAGGSAESRTGASVSSGSPAPAVDPGVDSRLAESVAPLDAAASAADPNPTEAQKEAGNYQMGHVRLSGLDISIENPQGTIRRGTDAGGKPWEITMSAHYGYVRKTEAVDGDHLDVFIKPGTPLDWSGSVFVVNQVRPDGKFDEHKVVLGVDSMDEARALYLAHYSADWKGLGSMVRMPFEDFKKWAMEGDLSKPLDPQMQLLAAPSIPYPGPLSIQPMAGLTAEQAEVEAKFAEWLQADVDRAVASYAAIPETENGRIIDMDEARKLSPDYNATRRSRSVHAVSVQKVVNALAVQRLLPDALESLSAGDVMGLTAGGPGSGKGTIRRIQPEEWVGAKFVYDGVLRNFDFAEKLIEDARARGAKTTIWYVHVPVERAVAQAMRRAEFDGRSVPLATLSQGHFDAQQTIVRLLESHAGDPDVTIRVIDNATGGPRVVTNPLTFFRDKRNSYSDASDVETRAQSAYRANLGQLTDPDARAIFEGTFGLREESPLRPSERRGERGLGESSPARAVKVDSAPLAQQSVAMPDADQAGQPAHPASNETSQEADYVTIYRAGDAEEVGVKPFSSWTPDEETAVEYQDNPGFGGPVLRKERVLLGNVLEADTTTRRGMMDFAEAIGYDREKGEQWFDDGWRYPWEESSKVKTALEESDFDAVQYVDDFPEGASTIIFTRPPKIQSPDSRAPSSGAQLQARAFVRDDIAEKVNADGKLDAVNGQLQARAFHGTPHKVDRFTTDKIGTGEGAQVYGWGLYFAENENVATSYRKNLSFKDTKKQFLNDLPEDADFEEVLSLLGSGTFSPYQERVIRALAADDWLGFDYPAQAISAAYRDLQGYDPSQELIDAVEGSGNSYTVDIDIEQDALLDWDKPLSEQSESVKAAIAKVDNRLVRALAEVAAGGRPRDVAMAHGVNVLDLHMGTGGAMVESLGGGREASMLLEAAGIPGIRYLDQGSRVSPIEIEAARKSVESWRGRDADQLRYAGQHLADLERKERERTYNYVIFDASKIRIIAENGVEVTAADVEPQLQARAPDQENPDQAVLDFEAIPVDQPAAQADGERFPIDRFRSELKQAMDIAAGFKIPGVDADEVRQRARIALADAARKFDPVLGRPFAAYAGVVVRNRLRDLARSETRRRSVFPASLDDPVGENGAESLGDFAEDTQTPSAVSTVVLDEARSVLNDAIAGLPAPMQTAVRGFYDRRTLEDIGRELGVAKQRVDVLQKEGFRRMRGKLGERGVSSVDQLLASGSSSENDIDALLADLDQEIADWQSAALAEEASGGTKTIGRPDLAHGADNSDVRGADQVYTDQVFRPQTELQWQEEADALLAQDYAGTRLAIESAGLSGQALTPVQTKAAEKIAADLRAKMLADGTPEARSAFNRFWIAFRGTGTAAGRALAARRDPLKTPAERYQEFLLDLMLKPRPAAQKEIDAAPTTGEQSQRIAVLENELRKARAQLRENHTDAALRVAALERQLAEQRAVPTKEFLIDRETKDLLEKLKAAGITPDDILKERVTLRLADRKIIDEFAQLLAKGSGDKAARQRAFRMILANRAFAEIAKATGLSESAVKQIKADFVAKMRQQHFAKFQAGAKADQETLITGAKVDDATAEREFAKWLKRLGIVDDAKQGRPKFNIEDPAHVMRMARAIQAATRAGILDMAYEYWIMGILSGPQTHVVNVAGNSLNAAWDMTLQRGMESLVNLFVRDSRSARVGEFKWLAKGLMPGISKGLSMASRAWSAEHDFFEHTILGTPLEIDHFDKAGNVRAAIPGKVGRVVRIPGRALLWADSFFKMALGQAEVGAQAYRMARRDGLTGRRLADRVALLSMTREQAIAARLARVKPSDEMVEYFARGLAMKDVSLDVDALIADPSSTAWEMAREQTAYDEAVKAGWSDVAWQRAVEKSKELTFQQDLRRTTEGGNVLEDLASRLQEMRGGNLLLSLFFPFVRTPYNIFRQGIRKSPLGSLNLMWQAGRGLYGLKDGKPYLTTHPEAVRDLAEQAIAWTAFALLFAAAQGDEDDDKKPILITGSMPFNMSSRGERELQQRAYGGDYVIRIGGRNGITLAYGRYEPFATVLGTTVDTIRAIKSRGATADNLDALWGYMTAQAQSKTFLQGFSDIAKGIEGSANVAQGTGRFFMQSLVPNIIRQPLRNLDDYVRDSKRAGLEYQALPAADLALPKTTIYGEDVRKDGNPVMRLFLSTPLEADEELQKADQLLLRWNLRNPSESYAPQSPSDTYVRAGTEHKMSKDEYYRFSQLAGRNARALLRSVVSPSRIENPRKEDVEAIRGAFEEARQKARQRLFGSE